MMMMIWAIQGLALAWRAALKKMIAWSLTDISVYVGLAPQGVLGVFASSVVALSIYRKIPISFAKIQVTIS